MRALDSKTNLPLENIKIQVECLKPPSTENVTTNKNGLAVLKCSDKGQYSIIVAGRLTKNYRVIPTYLDIKESITYKATILIKN
jgi:hypothetical protein